MALSLPGERSVAAASTFRPFVIFGRWISVLAAARTRRATLNALLELDHARLADLGISRDDVLAALAGTDMRSGHSLNAARARNARL